MLNSQYVKLSPSAKSVKPPNGFLIWINVLEKSSKFRQTAFKMFSCGLSSFSALSFTSISSVHDNRREDRIWAVHCGVYLGSYLTVGLSVWTFYVNDFDGNMTFECPDGNVVTGIGGYHSNHHEDRRYKFRCTFLKKLRRSSCSWTKYTNLDARWVIFAPTYKILAGVRSYHDNATQ